MKKILFFILTAFLFYSCSKDKTCEGAQKGELWASLCWTIRLENGETIEAVNLSDFDINLEHGLNVWVSYHEIPSASYCMMGRIVEIDCIWKNEE